MRLQSVTASTAFDLLQQLSCVQSRQGEVKQEEIGTPHIVLRGKPVKKVQRAWPTLKHLKDVLQPMGMEHQR